MNNYIRYYGQENTQIANSWQNVNSSHSLFTQTQETAEELYEDEKKRRVISRDSLFDDPESFYDKEEVEEIPQEPSSWTQQKWLKAGEGSREPVQGTSRQPGSRLQQNLSVALAQPVQMSKAESMMQKMGWRGGALGKSGAGIVEPITPNAVYATATRPGFGHQVEKPPAKKIFWPVRKEYNMEHFNTNTLLHILEFVKNDKEMEVVFDPRLFKYERKTIHNLVNDVIINGDMVAMNFDSVAQMDIVADINRHNSYVLCTLSEGEKSNRMLCLYKEAPEHVYLVTPNDLKDEIVDDTTDTAHDDDANEQSNKDKEPDKNDINQVKHGNKEDKQSESKGTTKMDLEEEENPFLKSITRILKNTQEADETISKEFEKDCTIENDTKDFIHKIIDYFKEFVEDETYSEFRFLGPFDDEEIHGINEFINNVHYCINERSSKDKKYDSALETVVKSECLFAVREDCNGSPVIYKCKKEYSKQ